MKNYKIIVFGTVQGVGFRYTTKAIADNMGIKGIVRNQSDGTVYIEAQEIVYYYRNSYLL